MEANSLDKDGDNLCMCQPAEPDVASFDSLSQDFDQI